MSTRDTPFAPGTPCWVELLSSDVNASKAFYGGLFGWTFEESGADYGGYVTALLDGRRVAGITPNSTPTSPDVWTTYIAARDASAAADAVADAGGHVSARVMAGGGLGAMAIVSAPTSAIFGVWQAGSHTGFGRYNEPGAVVWDEHHSREFATSTAFYQRVFGWGIDKSTGDTDEFRYYLGQVHGETVVGLMDRTAQMTGDTPSYWAVYFSVADADEAAARIAELGGTVTSEPTDTDFGRVVGGRDNAGVAFTLHSEKLAGAAAE